MKAILFSIGYLIIGTIMLVLLMPVHFYKWFKGIAV